jgi:hypothetical protein
MWVGVAFLVGLVAPGCDLGLPTSVRQPPTYDCFELQDPYAATGAAWYRGNFHLHSSHSDGALDAEEIVDLYSRNGFAVLCVSDHNQYGDQDGGILAQYQTDERLHDWNGDGVLHPTHVFGSGVEAYVRDYAALRPTWSRDRWTRPELTGWNGPIVLSGAEMTREGLHIGLIGLPGGRLERPGGGSSYLARTEAAGGFVFLAHPGEWNLYPDHLVNILDMSRFDGIEILNGLRLSRIGKATPTGLPQSNTPSLAAVLAAGEQDCAASPWPPDATPLWDALLARGYRLWGLANDDAHTWQGAADAYPFVAFDMVSTNDPSPEGFLSALHSGSCYASTGLFFQEIGVRNRAVVVSAPEADRLRFIGWGGRVLSTVEGGSGTYVATGDEGYVRVEAVGAPSEGKAWPRQAWSQPFYLQPTSCAGSPPVGNVE